jgi:hypothetical protein
MRIGVSSYNGQRKEPAGVPKDIFKGLISFFTVIQKGTGVSLCLFARMLRAHLKNIGMPSRMLCHIAKQ